MSDKEFSFSTASIIARGYGFRKQLAVISLIAFVVTTVVVFIIPPKYKSTVVLFPAPSSSISQTYLANNSLQEISSVFGADEEVEQIMQVLVSDEVREEVIARHDLYTLYDIDPKEKYARTKLKKEYEKNITFRRTQYMAVEVVVYDEDPQKAADIANDITVILDEVMNTTKKERARQAFRIVENELASKKMQLKFWQDSLREIMKRGVYDYESQSEVYNKAYADAMASGNTNGMKRLKAQLDTIAQYGGSYVSIRDYLYYESEKLSNLTAKYNEAKVDAEQQLTHVFVVNKAQKPDKKAKPQRTLIILISSIGTFMMALLLLLLRDYVQSAVRNYKNEQL